MIYIRLPLLISFFFVLAGCLASFDSASENNNTFNSDNAPSNPGTHQIDGAKKANFPLKMPTPKKNSKKIVVIISGGGTFSGAIRDYTTNFPRFYQHGLGIWYTATYKFNYPASNIYFAYTDGKSQAPESYNIEPAFSYFPTFEIPEFAPTQPLINQFKADIQAWDGSLKSVDTSYITKQHLLYDENTSRAFSDQVLTKKDYSGFDFAYNNKWYSSPIPIVTHATTLADIESIFDRIYAQVTAEPDFTVFIYILGHGLKTSPAIRVFSQNGYATLGESFLSKHLKKIGQHAKVLTTISSCYSGLFLSLTELKNVALTTSASGRSIAMFKSGVGQAGTVDDIELTKDYIADIIDRTTINFLREVESPSALIQTPVDTFFEHYILTHYQAIENVTWNSLDYLVDTLLKQKGQTPRFSDIAINDYADIEAEHEALGNSFPKEGLEQEIAHKIDALTSSQSTVDKARLTILRLIQNELPFIQIQDATINHDVFYEHKGENYLDLARFLFNREALQTVIEQNKLSASCLTSLKNTAQVITLPSMKKCAGDVAINSTLSSLTRQKYADNLTFLNWSALVRLGQYYDIVRLYGYLFFVNYAPDDRLLLFVEKLKLMQEARF